MALQLRLIPTQFNNVINGIIFTISDIVHDIRINEIVHY